MQQIISAAEATTSVDSCMPKLEKMKRLSKTNPLLHDSLMQHILAAKKAPELLHLPSVIRSREDSSTPESETSVLQYFMIYTGRKFKFSRPP
jgi:hypothetical protein